jgi:hypothetical protein
MVGRGVYVATEDGLKFQHDPTAVDDERPCSSEQFLVRFRYVPKERKKKNTHTHAQMQWF